MKKFAALTTVLLATALVSPMALAKGMNGSAHAPRTKVVRTEKAFPVEKKIARTKSNHRRKVQKNISRKPAHKGQKIQPAQV